MRQPALADYVDSIAVHLLPYWEGVPVEEAVDYALQRYAEVRERFPGKPVVIGEIGWPSNGDRRAAALATPDREAVFVRTFLARAASLNLDYYLMEAVDQPWKRAIEGAVGAHWGLLDAARQAKFAFAGPLQADPYWSGKALLATTLGLLTVILLLIVVSPMRLAGRLSLALSLQAVISFTVFLVGVPLEHYLRPVDIVPLALLASALAMIAAILLVQVFEFSELFWPGSLHRQVTLRPLAVDAPAPFVSIYLACCNEPPEMVKATIDSLLALDWPAFEVLVVDNNSGDPASMGLSHAIARGVIAGLRGRQAVFHVTRKGPVDRLGKTRPARRPGAFASVREEAVLLIGLLVSIAAISVQSGAATSAGAGGMLPGYPGHAASCVHGTPDGPGRCALQPRDHRRGQP